jgi:two-component system sensor histidine kinase/response regulator
MVRLLRAMGCPHVDSVGQGEEALRLLMEGSNQSGSYDLLVVDWLLPDMTGGALIDRLLSRGGALPACVIVVSATDPALLRQEAVQTGITEVVQKPLMPGQLAKICRTGKDGIESDAPQHAMPRLAARVLEGMNVLVVEDNLMNQQVACEMLRDWGAHVEVAGNGQEALDCVAAHPPAFFAAILMDIEMPVMDGREATLRLREDSRHTDLPIIAMTAHVVGHGMSDALAEGVSAYVAKPVEPEVLLSMLQRYWGGAPDYCGPPAWHSIPDDCEEFVEVLMGIDAIDATMLLRRFAGRVRFLRRALHQFADDYANWIASFERSLEQGEMDVARRQVHTLKGLAGTFAMSRLQSGLVVMEAALREGVNPVGELEQIREQLSSLLPALAALPVDLADDVPDPPPEPLTAVLEHLRTQLREGDGEAEELWRQNKERLTVLYNPRQVAAIDYAIGQWNFAEALDILGRFEQGTGGR